MTSIDAYTDAMVLRSPSPLRGCMREHGSFELALNNNILTFKAYGAWNLQTALRWSRDVKALAEPVTHQSWKSLVDLSNWELSVPEVRECVRELNIWLEQNNLKAMAVVYRLSAQESLLRRSNAVFKDVDIEYFTDSSQAIKWLNKTD